MTIDLQLTKFESAAQAAGFAVQVHKEWPDRALEAQNIKVPYPVLKEWIERPVTAKYFEQECAKRDIGINEEYLAVLQRWNGLGLCKPGSDLRLMMGSEIPCFDRVLYHYDDLKDIEDYADFVCIALGGGIGDLAFRRRQAETALYLVTNSVDETTYPASELVYPSLECYFACATEALERGLDISDVIHDPPSVLAYAEIALTLTGLPSWREEVEYWREEISKHGA